MLAMLKAFVLLQRSRFSPLLQPDKRAMPLTTDFASPQIPAADVLCKPQARTTDSDFTLNHNI
jgi:hypothetical protein